MRSCRDMRGCALFRTRRLGPRWISTRINYLLQELPT